MEQSQQPPQDMQNAYEQAAAESVNLPMAIVGAAAGAAVGGLVWFAIEYFAHYQVGFIAILSGLAAGFGAVTLGRGHGFQIGVIAAAFGLLGIIGGSYGSFVAQKAKLKNELREEVSKAYPQFDSLSAEEQEAGLAMLRTEIDSRSYIDYMKDDSKNLAWMALFGVFGLAYGFKLGAGGLNTGDTA